MKISEKLKFVQKISGLTQNQLAEKIGVTFVAFNRWINDQAHPRPAMEKKIDEIYKEITGEKTIPADVLSGKKQFLAAKSKQHKNILRLILSRPDLRDQLILSLTYNSNKIEGSTLTENETGAILFRNKALPDKSLTEQLEAKNHQTALNFLFEKLTVRKHLEEDLILKLHAILMNGIHPDAGFYRSHSVRIVGTQVVTANYLKVPHLMSELVRGIGEKTNDYLSQTSFIHANFEKIHPFADGNGRIGRLLIQAMLLSNNFPPAIIRQGERQRYFMYLQKAQINNDYSLLEDFLCDAVLEGYKIIEE